MDIWEKRRRNLAAILAAKGLKPTPVAREADLSVNTLNKFLRGETKSLRWDSLEAVCRVAGIHNPSVLDADNPFSETKNQIYAIIEDLTDDQAAEVLKTLRAAAPSGR